MIRAVFELILGKYGNAQIKIKGLRQAKRLAKENYPLKLNLGCGAYRIKDFVGVDMCSQADLRWDLQWGLPFKDESVLEIRSNHCFEHLGLADLITLLKECKRVLVKGGILDFSVPHINPYLSAYLKNDVKFLSEKIYDIPEEKRHLYSTSFDKLSWLLLRDGEHKSIFDKEAILEKVKFAGFSNVSVREYDVSRDGDYRYSSVYVMAKKE
ncbi:MAG: methyltransferase domain-containing protein [Candidatus Omnitrophica bacterium]|nr:methyltransferase domain-containing protein [Candidatus Omnitrophota bacterium]MBU1870175.1 methyltransferase domain-containing protein [Candidatus Omnitrophota bacterium]